MYNMSNEEFVTRFKKLKPEDQNFLLNCIQVLIDTNDKELVEKMYTEYITN